MAPVEFQRYKTRKVVKTAQRLRGFSRRVHAREGQGSPITEVRPQWPPISHLLGCSPMVVRTKALHRFNQLPKKVPPVAETSRKCLSHGVVSGGDYGSVQIQEGLQLSVAPPATSFWCSGCCQKACGGRSARASLGSLSERLGMGRTGSRTASRLGITHTKQAGLAPWGHAGTERGDTHRIRTGRAVPERI